MKLVATGFLVVATLLYAGGSWWMSSGAPSWVGYVRAAAEAGMVGALADWFAVTALFRRPLGLPIPHTAIIPTRKDTIGESLGEFVGANFLSEAVIRQKLRSTQITKWFGTWLADPAHALRLTEELATMLRAAVTVLRDEDVQRVLEQILTKQVMKTPWGPPLGKLLTQVLADGSHRRLVDLTCEKAYEWIRDNYESVSRVVEQRAPSWSPKFVDDLVADRIYNEVVKFAYAVKSDPDHQMRKAVDKFLIEFAEDLQTDPDTIAKAEAAKQQVLNHPEIQHFIDMAWTKAKKLLLDAADDPSSALRQRVQEGLMNIGQRLVADEALRTKVDAWIENAAVYVVVNYRDQITTLITDTVARWDAEETSRKIELQVGRDLQFIRINGTVVGALAGLVIYTASELAF
ncbi:DUF445 domain-containing protein [Pseudonocardiaceae bacterium YIM PH 21723]|nr:DUF445 domain-containing protein [Pseudonocardiaceae bacterium YIM PH 21723]